MSDCSYADSFTLSAAPENITLFEPFQADAVPYHRFERFFASTILLYNYVILSSSIFYFIYTF